MRRLKRIRAVAVAAVLTFSSLLSVGLTSVVHASGTCTWTGGGGDNNISTGANWDQNGTCSGTDPVNNTLKIPGNDDVLNFNSGSNISITNDAAAGLTSVGNLFFTGAGHVTVNGNALTLNGSINDQSAGAIFDLNLTLGTTVTVLESNGALTQFGTATTSRTISTASLALLFSGSTGASGAKIYSALSQAGQLAVNVTGGGVVVKNAASNYTGAVTVIGGILEIANANGLGSTSGVTVATAGTLALDAPQDATFNFPVSLGGPGADSTHGTLLVGAVALGIGGGNAPSTVPTATLAGAVTLTSDVNYSGAYNAKVTGTYTSNSHKFTALAGTQGTITTPDGTVEAAAQTVTVNSGDNQASTTVDVTRNVVYVIDGQRGATTVEAGGTLEGTGTVGALTVLTDGTVAPGHSPGCLNTGNLTEGGNYNVEIGGTDPCTGYDQLKVTGTVDLTNGVLNVTDYNNFQFAKGQTFTIIDNDSSDAVTGTFTGLAEGATFTLDNGTVLAVSYVGGDGNDVVLTVQDVPGAPDTGFSLVGAHPLVTLGVAVLAAGTIAGVAQKTRKNSARR